MLLIIRMSTDFVPECTYDGKKIDEYGKNCILKHRI